MLPKWLRTPTKSARSQTLLHLPRCSSFKDIDQLVKPEPEPEPDLSRSSSICHRVRFFHPLIRSLTNPRKSTEAMKPPPILLPKKIILYHTSISIVRRTFEDCRAIKQILEGFKVPIDRRDVFTEPKFREELEMVTGCKNLTLPRVFIGGNYIGGPEEVKAMHDSGELGILIRDLPVAGSTKDCKGCGGLGFTVCQKCDGSHKIYSDELGDFNLCNECNTSGMVRCTGCCLSTNLSV